MVMRMKRDTQEGGRSIIGNNGGDDDEEDNIDQLNDDDDGILSVYSNHLLNPNEFICTCE